MALRYLDDCGDHYSYLQIENLWTSVVTEGLSATPVFTGGYSIDVGAGRCGGNCFSFSGSSTNNANDGFWKTFDPQQTWIAGGAYKPAAAITDRRQRLISFNFADVPQVTVTVLPDGTLEVSRGHNTFVFSGVSLGISSNSLLAGNWYYIELKATIANGTSGSFELRVNEETWLSGSGIDTSWTGVESANTVCYGGVANGGLIAPNNETWDRWDDIYIADTQTNMNDWQGRVTDFMGDITVTPYRPDADGNYTQWTAQAAGAHFEELDDTPSYDTATYISANAVGLKDSWSYEPIPTSENVLGMQINYYAAKEEPGLRSFKGGIRNGGTDNLYPIEFFPSLKDQIGWNVISDRRPWDQVKWSAANLNASEGLIEVIQ